MAKKTKFRKKPFDRSVLLKEPDLFKRVEQVFVDRGMIGLPMIKQVRKALVEWCESQAGKTYARSKDNA